MTGVGIEWVMAQFMMTVSCMHNECEEGSERKERAWQEGSERERN